MGAAAIPLLVGGSILSAGSAVAGFQAQRTAAEIQRGEADVAAQQEELGATAREADRKGRLAAALATQNATAGAKGIAAFEGSPLSILEADIAAEAEGTERDIFATELSALTTRAGAKVREKQLKTGATIGLLGSLGQSAVSAGFAAR